MNLNFTWIELVRKGVFLVKTVGLVIAMFHSAFGQSKGPETLKVMSYNIRIASPPSKGWGYTDLPATAEVINRVKPDLVALQEVDAFTDRSGKGVDQARELGTRTGLYYHFAKAIDRSNGDYGVAILSRFPIIKAESYRLSVVSGHPEAEVRAVAAVTVKTPLGKLVFLSAHLDHLSDQDRAHQIGQLNEILRKYRTLPVILGADLNTTPSNPVINGLIRYLEKPCTDCEWTFPADRPNRTLDYLMLSKKASRQFKRLTYATVNETYASDHLPLMMELSLN
ncbi:endonuclease/exonuclease/phosphatase family metal-dependent hydrolase [Larkinella arboricola]|uniref:Endonuclease/exonuclease/phosphatase family metal-dependent hydrolase n=1 Tax=Larkinella arboricola TaxID=643671 RepID=A0A327WVS7_LARAB|nr:endonuclease/exonuclease/phosphatase family protein [Larkinella arboricola]RAJ93200.1 endonuclease/exonuclease/phosphatase family metal-dependent hydrolase [Larkinella arboricola]